MIKHWIDLIPSDCRFYCLKLSNKSKILECPSVYLVLSGDEIIYVGSTVNLKNRFRVHHRSHQFSKDNVLAWFDFSGIEETRMRQVEVALIDLIVPTLNDTSTGKPLPESQKRAQKKYVERHPEKLKSAQRKYEEKRGHRDRAEYMREYRRRKKQESQGDV